MIIGLHGRMGAGKNEAAKRLATIQSAREVVEVSFAKKLKESFAALFNIDLAYIEDAKNDPGCEVALLYNGQPHEELTLSFRKALQRYGTESHRDVFGQDFWLDAALPLDQDYTGKLYVVTDMRFPNEIERVKQLGGYTVMIADDHRFVESNHSSERLSPCDYVVDNTIRDDNFRNLDEGLMTVLESIFQSRYPSEWLHTV